MSDGRKIFGSLVIAVAVFFFWPAVIGTWQEVSALRASVAERQQLLEKRQSIAANLSQQMGMYQEKVGQADGQKFAALVPVKKDVAEIVSAVGDIANTSGVTIVEFHTTDVKAKSKSADQYQTLALTIDLTGSYAGLRAFLTSLEQYVRLLNVDSITVNTDPRNPGQLRFEVKADTYFLK